VGPGHAGRLLFSADTIAAAEAQRIGLVDIIGPAPEATGLAARIAANAPGSVSAMKRIIRAKGNDCPVESAALFDSFFACPAFAEGLQAFRDKRQPDFSAGPDPEPSKFPLAADV
jgi:enoyl-CoA hydratase